MNLASNSVADEAPILYFEIESGVTQHPRRPVTRGRFLLGSGDACHMRLGGDDIPPIHSMIVAETDEIVLERLSTGPALFVNGQDVETATLNDGDKISIGRISFSARFESAAISNVASVKRDLMADIELTQDELDQLTGRQPETMSVVELIDQLEVDMNLVDDAEKQQETAIQAIEHEALAIELDDSASESDVPFDSEELENMIEHLNLMTAQLENRAARLNEREAEYATAAEELMEQQSRLHEQVAEVTRQLAEKDKDRLRIARRKSA